MNQEKKVVKIRDVIENQIPEFLVSENPNFVEFLKQYYLSQEFQGASIDLAENLVSYKTVDAFNKENLIKNTTLSVDVDFFDDVIFVESTKGWPKEYGLLKIDNEIITYSGITTNSFTGCIRGFSGIESLTTENNPEFLTFSKTEADEHVSGTSILNLSNLFLQEFFKKIKYQFAPGFEELEFDENINPQNFISKVRTFYQSKGTDDAYKILFKVLYNQDVEILKPQNFCFTTSDDKWVITETFLCEYVSGDPVKIKGQTLYQDEFIEQEIFPATGSIYEVEEYPIDGTIFYNLKIFAGYSNNLNPKGSIFGTFVPTSKTFITDVAPNASTQIFVDSTIGFPKSGTLSIGNNTVTYTDKTNNQFLNCSGVLFQIDRGTKVTAPNFVYSYEDGDSTKLVKFRIHNVLSKIEDTNLTFAYDGDPINVTDIGNPKESVFVSSLYYNHALNVPAGIATSQLTSFTRDYVRQGFDTTSGLVVTKYNHNLRNGDIVDLYLKNTNALVASNLTVITSLEKEFSVQQITDPSIQGKEVFFRRRIKKTSSPANVIESISNKFTSNIQDSFSDSNNYYLTSNGFPSYQINPYKRESTFSVGDIDLDASHNFYSGELVTVVGYATTDNYQNKLGITTGVSFYVSRVNTNKIRVSESRENVGLSSYINFVEYDNAGNYQGKIKELKLISSPLFNNNFTSAKLFKKFPKNPDVPVQKIKTQPGPVAIFANGVEIQNYKSFDKLYYGKIDSITVLNGGENYSLLNPPKFKIFDGNIEDTQTRLLPQLTGKLKRIDVTDPGFDYVETPTIIIEGGGNFDVVTEAKMKDVSNVITFNSTTKSNVVSTASNLFIFNSLHRFETGETVVYKTFGTRPIGIGTLSTDGTLLDGAVYYIINVGAGTSLRLAKTKEDALAANPLKIRTNGGGINQFISLQRRRCVDEVLILENNKDFQYRKISVPPEDINVYDDIITSPNHGFKTGDEIVVSVDGTFLEGLEPNTYYYIVALDKNKFKLSFTKDENNYVDIISTDFSTTYFFEYSPIRVRILGNLSVSGISTIGYDATVTPIVEGSVTEVQVQKGLAQPAKSDLGSREIINFNKSPSIVPLEGSDAVLEPLVVDGKVNEVVVKSQGQNYFNNFELVVLGEGYGAKLSPVLNNGKIVQVNIVNPGVGYSQNTTSVRIAAKGVDLKIKANLQNWTIDEISKLGYTNVEKGILFGKKYSLFGNVFGTFFLNTDLINQFNIPATPTTHSKIIGWSYDGCPIYGPYGFTNPDGTGGLSRMRSGYTKNKISPSSTFDCVEDYKFTNSGTLDKHNGRFCKTPEYPNGVYAYFCTLDTNNIPEFPYVIGDEYHYSPQLENFDLKYNQDINFNALNIQKSTKPYRIDDKENGYEYFNYLRSEIVNDAIVTSTTRGSVDSLLIANTGSDYEVGDSIIFDNTGTGGAGASAVVTEVGGVGVTTFRSTKTTLNNLILTSNDDRIVAISTIPHELSTDYYIRISGLSTNAYPQIDGFKKIIVEDVSVGLSTYLPDSTTTGLVTSIQIRESITSFKIDSKIKIENETLTILGLDRKNNLINVLRDSGSPAHLQGTTVTVLQNEFVFENPRKYVLPEENISYYFKSSDCVSVGIGTTPGSGNLLSVTPFGPGVSESKFVRNAGIFLPNHKFKDGEKVIYTPGTSTIVTNGFGNLNQISNLYIVKLEDNVVGLVTNRNDIKKENKLLYYIASGTGSTHKFITDRNVVTGIGTLNNVTVSTDSTHGLIKGNFVKLSAISGITTNFVVGYSTVTKRVIVDSNVNPRIDVYENDIVRFNVSSPSLTGADFNFYTDPGFQNKYFGADGSILEVVKTSNFVTLQITDKTPKILYYNLESLTNKIYSDITVANANTLIINPSAYTNSGYITTSTPNRFTLNYPTDLERPVYSAPTSTLSYTILSSGIKGPISSTKFTSKGNSYRKIPSIKSVVSKEGNGASLVADSFSIGKIKKIQILNTKSIYPSDTTLSPVSNVYSILRVTDNFKVSNISVTNGGKNYLTAPLLRLYNKKSNTIISNFSAIATLKDSSVDSVTILNPGSGLKYTDNKIITINHTNGIRILEASASGISAPYTVTLTLETPIAGFTTDNQLEIQVGDKIFVEGISHVIGSGYNSSNYKYEPFTVTFVDQALGSPDAAIIRYELNTDPGSFSVAGSFDAKVIKYDNLPQFEVSLEESEFYNAEKIHGSAIIDNDKNTKITNLIKIKSAEGLEKNKSIFGEASKSRGTIFDIDNFTTSFEVNSSVSEQIGWKDFRGNLSSILQKLPDNDYYQKFSYSLKSKEQFVNWDPIVSDLSHVSGYKKFGDLIIESKLPVGFGSTLSIKSDSDSQINITLNGYGNINTVSGFDLVSEEDVDDNNGDYSEYIKFKSKKLSNFLLSVENRVLSIDDISGLFDTDNFPTVQIEIDTIDSNASVVLKYIFFIASTTSFFGTFEVPQLLEVFVTRDGQDVNLTSYSYFYPSTENTVSILGDIVSDVNATNFDQTIVSFIPKIPFNSYAIRAIKEVSQVNSGIATQFIGYNKNVEVTTQYPASGSPTIETFYSIPMSECKSGTLFVGVSNSPKEVKSAYELSFINVGGQINYNVYAEQGSTGIGSVGVSTSGSNIEFTFTPVAGIGVTVHSNLNLLVNTPTIPATVLNELTQLNSDIVAFSGNGPQIITTISDEYAASKITLEIEKTVGVTTEKCLVQLDNVHFQNYLNITEYGFVGDLALNKFTFESNYNSGTGTYILTMEAQDSADYVVKFFQRSIANPN
jgi:hypothetical protein